ncbi:MAG: hypothetical protein IIC30_03355 [Chloroflexi bacterium]|nr:hypothetical protein [Chloroflexota bacterium]
MPIPTPIAPFGGGGGSSGLPWGWIIPVLIALAVLPGVGAAVLRFRR